MTLSPELVRRFAADLDRLLPAGARLGVAVSGGPDSLALLLLAAEARPGLVAAATVDHGLRAESRAEAAMVAEVCAGRGIPHDTLTVTVAQGASVQAQARAARYAALAEWAAARGLAAVATAHHSDDQAETLLMRLNRGSGVAGLAGVREAVVVDGLRVVRPLLGWRREELAKLCRDAAVMAVDDPSNSDPRFDRVHIRHQLRAAPWLDPPALARSAAHMAEADEAIGWAVDREWAAQVTIDGQAATYRPQAPREIRRRVVARLIDALGQGARGSEVARLVDRLERSETATLGGVRCRGGAVWRFVPEAGRTD